MIKELHLVYLNNFFIFIIGLFLFFGCAKNPENITVPSWYFANHQNSSVYLKASGEGLSLEEAKNNALASISSSIIVNISGTIEKNTQSSGDFYQKNIKSDIKSELAKIKFTNVVIEKQEFNGEKFYVLVRINKQELFDSLKNELNILLIKMEKSFENGKKYIDLEKIAIMQNVVNNIKDVITKVEILTALNNEFDGAMIVQKMQSYSEALEFEKSNLKFSLESDNAVFGDYAKKMVNENQFKIDQESNLKIKVSTSSMHSNSMGWEIVKSVTTLQVFSGKKLLKTKIVNSLGRSSTSRENALSNSAKNFYDVLGGSGFASVLFD